RVAGRADAVNADGAVMPAGFPTWETSSPCNTGHDPTVSPNGRSLKRQRRGQGFHQGCGKVTSHSLTVWSTLPEASILPSALKATEKTGHGYPLRVTRPSPLAASHSLIVLSALALAMVLPSGLKTTEVTNPVWLLRVTRSCPVATSHSL